MSSVLEIDGNGDTKGGMWDLEQKLDPPMDEEAGRLKNMYREKKFSALLLLRLAFQSLGVVYGDLGTSPLYVSEDVIGALSLIIYSLTLIPLLKYVFLVCRANDSGQGGTFVLYSLLRRHAKVNTIPNQHRTDEELTTYSRSTFHENSFAAKTKRWLEAHAFRKNMLLILVLVGTCMVIGDGILTPAISDKSNVVRQAAATAYGALCAVLCSVPITSNGRQNHALLSNLVDRFIGWALPLIRVGDGPAELALESLREFLSVGDIGAPRDMHYQFSKHVKKFLRMREPP